MNELLNPCSAYRLNLLILKLHKEILYLRSKLRILGALTHEVKLDGSNLTANVSQKIEYLEMLTGLRKQLNAELARSQQETRDSEIHRRMAMIKKELKSAPLIARIIRKFKIWRYDDGY